MHENRHRYVVLCQQLLAVGTVLAVAASASGVVSLEIVSPGTDTRESPAWERVNGD